MKTIFKNFFSHPSANRILSFFLLIAIVLSIVWIANAAAPNPGHTISEIGNVVQGDILYGSATDVISVLAKSTTAGQFLSNSGASNNPAWATPAGGGGKTTVRMTADVSNSTVTAANVTGLEMTVVASTNYSFICYLIADAAATTTGIQMSMNGPASPTQFTALIQGFSAAVTLANTNINAYETFQTNTASAGTTRTVFVIQGVLRNGVNAGTLIPRFKSEIAASAVNVRIGSWCEVF